MGISVINNFHACVMETEVDAPEENRRLSHPYQLSVFPLMTVDHFEANLQVLGLVNEQEYALSVFSGTKTQT